METLNPELLPTADTRIELQLKALDTASTCKSRKLSGGEKMVKMESAWAREFVCACMCGCARKCVRVHTHACIHI